MDSLLTSRLQDWLREMERRAQTNNKKPLTCRSLTIMVGVAQRPGFIGVKMRIAPYPRSREVRVSQEASFPIKRRAVPMETRCKDNGDVHVTLTALQRAVRYSLEVQRRNALPHIECPPDGFMSLSCTHLRGHILYTGKKKTTALIRWPSACPFIPIRLKRSTEKNFMYSNSPTHDPIAWGNSFTGIYLKLQALQRTMGSAMHLSYR